MEKESKTILDYAKAAKKDKDKPIASVDIVYTSALNKISATVKYAGPLKDRVDYIYDPSSIKNILECLAIQEGIELSEVVHCPKLKINNAVISKEGVRIEDAPSEMLNALSMKGGSSTSGPEKKDTPKKGPEKKGTPKKGPEKKGTPAKDPKKKDSDDDKKKGVRKLRIIAGALLTTLLLATGWIVVDSINKDKEKDKNEPDYDPKKEQNAEESGLETTSGMTDEDAINLARHKEAAEEDDDAFIERSGPASGEVAAEEVFPEETYEDNNAFIERNDAGSDEVAAEEVFPDNDLFIERSGPASGEVAAEEVFPEEAFQENSVPDQNIYNYGELGSCVEYEDMETQLSVVDEKAIYNEVFEFYNLVVPDDYDAIYALTNMRNRVLDGTCTQEEFMDTVAKYVFENNTYVDGNFVERYNDLHPFGKYIVIRMSQGVLSLNPYYHGQGDYMTFDFDTLAPSYDIMGSELYENLTQNEKTR